MGPIQTYKLLYSKGNHKQNEKTTHRLGENICKLCDQKGLNFQNHKQLIQCNTKKKKNLIKNGQKTQTFLQRRQTDGQQAHEKTLNMPNY